MDSISTISVSFVHISAQVLLLCFIWPVVVVVVGGAANNLCTNLSFTELDEVCLIKLVQHLI